MNGKNSGRLRYQTVQRPPKNGRDYAYAKSERFTRFGCMMGGWVYIQHCNITQRLLHNAGLSFCSGSLKVGFKKKKKSPDSITENSIVKKNRIYIGRRRRGKPLRIYLLQVLTLSRCDLRRRLMLFIDGIFLTCANMQALCTVTNHFCAGILVDGRGDWDTMFWKSIYYYYYYYYLGALKRL
jgi:hypothetical protein